jgi:hypothetical protein
MTSVLVNRGSKMQPMPAMLHNATQVSRSPFLQNTTSFPAFYVGVANMLLPGTIKSRGLSMMSVDICRD